MTQTGSLVLSYWLISHLIRWHCSLDDQPLKRHSDYSSKQTDSQIVNVEMSCEAAAEICIVSMGNFQGVRWNSRNQLHDYICVAHSISNSIFSCEGNFDTSEGRRLILWISFFKLLTVHQGYQWTVIEWSRNTKWFQAARDISCQDAFHKNRVFSSGSSHLEFLLQRGWWFDL